ncbi:hypothetical protein ACLMJK_008672 [Lecanora helva]
MEAIDLSINDDNSLVFSIDPRKLDLDFAGAPDDFDKTQGPLSPMPLSAFTKVHDQSQLVDWTDLGDYEPNLGLGPSLWRDHERQQLTETPTCLLQNNSSSWSDPHDEIFGRELLWPIAEDPTQGNRDPFTSEQSPESYQEMTLDRNPLDLFDSSTPTPIGFECITKAATTSRSYLTDDDRWQATLSRSRAADHHFLYGVLSTKIYCRPSCSSRRPVRKQALFFPFPNTIQAAQAAKLRACKRCKPDSPGTADKSIQGIVQSLRVIVDEAFGKVLTNEPASLQLECLAKKAGLSPFHFHRLFKATTQVTPGEFFSACHALALQDSLGQDSHRGSGDCIDAAKRISKSRSWSPRCARKALGGISPMLYAQGAVTHDIKFCTIRGAFGETSVAFSLNGDILAVICGAYSELRIQSRFPHADRSDIDVMRLRGCLQALQESGQDRATQLPQDLLAVLWRARVWLHLTRDNVLRT